MQLNICSFFQKDKKKRSKDSSFQKDKKKYNKVSFFQKYKRFFAPLALLFFLLILAYIIVYLCFCGSGIVPVGNNLEKTDWLMFLGAYLSFAGTISVSLIAALQSRYYAEQNELKAQTERKEKIQPIFSVKIERTDSQIPGMVDIFNPHDLSTLPKHKNVTISIENVGVYPIRNVIIFDKYLYQLLKSNEKQELQLAYSDSPDIVKGKKYLIEILESDFERTDKGIPKWFNINYDDIDGNEMYQTFKLKEFDGEMYYSLEDMQQI